MPLREFEDDGADFTGRAFFAVAADYLQIVSGGGFSHRAGLRLHSGEVSGDNRAFRLPVSLEHLDSCLLVEFVVDLGVERLARSDAVFERREVELLEVRADEVAVDGRRGAERVYSVFLDFVHEEGWLELNHVVHEDGAAANPLAVYLSPDRLSPARLRHREMEPVVDDVLPPLRGRDVPERVEEVVLDHLRVSRRSRREIEEHRVVSAGERASLGLLEILAERRHFLSEVEPFLFRLRVVFLRADNHHFLDARGFFERCLDFADYLFLVEGDNHLHLRRVEPVLNVFRQQLVRRGDSDRADSVHGKENHPEFPAPAENHHHFVAFPYSLRGKKCRGLLRFF